MPWNHSNFSSLFPSASSQSYSPPISVLWNAPSLPDRGVEYLMGAYATSRWPTGRIAAVRLS